MYNYFMMLNYGSFQHQKDSILTNIYAILPQ